MALDARFHADVPLIKCSLRCRKVASFSMVMMVVVVILHICHLYSETRPLCKFFESPIFMKIHKAVGFNGVCYCDIECRL